jgi:hypothetical protein
MNIEVASQHPDAFVLNSVPEKQSPPILPAGGVVGAALEPHRITLLVFCSTPYKDFLDRCPEVTRIEDFSPWSVYEVRPRPTP